MADTTEIETAIETLGDDAPMERVVDTYLKLQHIGEVAASAKKTFQDRLIEWMKANGVWSIEIPRGEDDKLVLWFGHAKKTSCIDKAKVLETIIDLSEGDIENAARDFLSSEPFKHGAIKRAIGDEEKYAKLFETVVVDKLESGEVAPKKLQVADTRFMK